MITLIQLEYIVAVDNYRHFATAAEKCFVTQPTLSMQIKKLEDDLGIVLFDRSRQPVIPTEQGKHVLEQARIVLQEASKIKTIIKDIKEELSGELRIGLIPTISPYLLPLFAGSYKSSFPKIDLKVEEAVTESIEDMLVKDILDVGVVVTPLKNKNIIELPLYYEEMMIYHHPDHRFSAQSVIQVNKLDPSDLWLLRDGHCFRNQVINFCDFKNLETHNLPFGFEGGTIDTLMKIIDREGGYTLIPELSVMDITGKGQVKRFESMKPLREVSLIYTRRFAKTKIIEVLAESIKNSVPEDFMDKERGILVEWR